MSEEPKKWITRDGEAFFAQWRERQEWSWKRDGADPREIREDLEMHLQAKAAALGRPLAAADLDQALGEVTGSPGGDREAVTLAPPRSMAQRFFLFRWTRLLASPFFLGWWPLLVVLVEATTGIFGRMLYDPISRWPQLLLLLAVSGLALAGQELGRERREAPWFQFLIGAAIIPALYWGLLSLPVMVIGTVGYGYGVLLSMGLALIAFPIFLICLAIAAAPIFAGLGFWKESRTRQGRRPWLAGLGLGFLILMVVEGPAYVTRYGLAANDPGVVRKWGSQELLRQIALGKTWGPPHEDTSGLVTRFGMVGGLMGSQNRPKVEDVLFRQRFYYRVTGESPPRGDGRSFLSGRSGNRWMGGFDSGLGGDEVGPFVKNLSLSDSRLDGHVDAASGLGYWEWTMEFHNEENDQKEARTQVLLPPGGVVSRLTLWIDGVPEEAAFGAKSQVAAAYKAVVQRRRDPVLVRSVGPDRVLMQCFPVPANGKMKIRVGITAPLDEAGRLYLPRLAEKNFAFGDDLETGVWVQGDVEMSMEGLAGASQAGRWRETHGTVSQESLTREHHYVACHEVPEPGPVWTEDPFASESERILVREKLPDREGPSQAVVLVVDGSKFFTPWAESFRLAVDKLRQEGSQIEVVYAAEEGIFGEEDELKFVGGQDNLPALVRGMEVAGKTMADRLIWLHGAQPVELENTGILEQLLERQFHRVTFSTIDLAGGPNRLLEQLSSSISVSSAGRPRRPDDLEGVLRQAIAGEGRKYRFTTLPSGSTPEGKRVWDQLARWRVWEDVQQGLQEGAEQDDLARQAALYQLVTPVSGAVVLERQEQYERFDLKQVEEGSTSAIPGIPEPSTSFLLLMASGLVWRRHRNSFSRPV